MRERPWITSGSILSAIWRLSIPMMAGMALQNLMSIVDMIFVGRLGPTAIAAVGISAAALGVIHMLGVGIVTGSTALVAMAAGAGDASQRSRVAAQSVTLALAVSVVIGALGVPFAQDCLLALGADAEVAATGAPYIQVAAGGSVAMMLSFVFGAILRGTGDAMTPLKAVALANLINLLLDPVLIFGLLGMPALGVTGSALATLIANVFAAGYLATLFFARGHEGIRLHARDMRPDLGILSALLRIGVFVSMQMLMTTLASLALVRIVAGFGTAPLAAHGIAMKLQMVALMPGMGFGAAAATLVGQNLGARQPDRAARAGWLTAAVYAAFALALSLGFAVFAEPVVGVFTASPEVAAVGAGFLRWFSAGFVFNAFGFILGRSMHGAGDTFAPMALTGLEILLVRLPLAWFLSRALGSATGVWMAVAAGGLCQATVFSAVFAAGRWKRGRRAASIGHAAPSHARS